jgi:Cys-rich repeat protein
MAGGGGDGTGGSCQPACAGLTPKCNASGHCVGCLADSDCPTGDVCHVVSAASASCVPGCVDDSRCGGGKCCGGACVDPMSDPSNCGGCGKPCSGPHEQAACTAGTCGTGACDPGWGDCDGSAANGCEVNLRVDPMNCTACGMKCALASAVQACADGCYIAACQFGFDDCDVNTGDGCETAVLADPSNCGQCGRDCSALPNATAACTDGNCVLGSCKAGFADCNGDPNDGCEVNLNFDAKNCSQCGMVCPMNLPNCGGGVCTLQPVLVGQFMVNMGPMWTTNPPCYTCQEACALLYGGAANTYGCSTQMNIVDHMASVDGWGDSTHCVAQGGTPVADTYKVGNTYDCGAQSCSFSAYVTDHGCTSVNYCFH